MRRINTRRTHNKWTGIAVVLSVAAIGKEDWLPTFLAAAGEPNIKEKLLKGYKAGDKTFKNHLDGYNFMPYFLGQVPEGPRKEIFYFDDSGNLNAMRYGPWKINFSWIEGNLFTGKRTSANIPLVVNLREDPFEKTPFRLDVFLSVLTVTSSHSLR